MKKKTLLLGTGLLGMSLLLGACGETDPKKRTEDLSVNLNDKSVESADVEGVEKFEKIDPELILELDGVEVLYVGAKEDDLWGEGLEFEIANNSEEERIIQAEDISVNNLMATGITFSSTLPAGKASVSKMDFYDTELRPGDVVEGFIYVLDSEYSRVSDRVPFTITIK